MATAGALAGTCGLLAGQVWYAGRRGRLTDPVRYRVQAVVAPDEARQTVTLQAHAARAGRRPAGNGSWEAGLVRLAAVGDSSIAGVGAPEAEQSLAVLVAERVARRLQRPVLVEGYGVSGARTADARRHQVARLAGQRVDAVLIVVGANDVLHLTPPPRFAAETQALVRDLHAVTGAPAVVCSLPEFRAVTALPQPLRAIAVGYATWLGALQRRAVEAADGAVFVDARAEAGPRFIGRLDVFSADGLHPSPEGYALLADVLAGPVADAAAARLDRA